jgi:hypothetical protein
MLKRSGFPDGVTDAESSGCEPCEGLLSKQARRGLFQQRYFKLNNNFLLYWSGKVPAGLPAASVNLALVRGARAAAVSAQKSSASLPPLRRRRSPARTAFARAMQVTEVGVEDLSAGTFKLEFEDGSTYHLRASDPRVADRWIDALEERVAQFMPRVLRDDNVCAVLTIAAECVG